MGLYSIVNVGLLVRQSALWFLQGNRLSNRPLLQWNASATRSRLRGRGSALGRMAVRPSSPRCCFNPPASGGRTSLSLMCRSLSDSLRVSTVLRCAIVSRSLLRSLLRCSLLDTSRFRTPPLL